MPRPFTGPRIGGQDAGHSHGGWDSECCFGIVRGIGCCNGAQRHAHVVASVVPVGLSGYRWAGQRNRPIVAVVHLALASAWLVILLS
jgi:hypothetical protein